MYPVISGSGARVAYSAFEKNRRVEYVAAPGGVPEKLCEGCPLATGWSRDEKTLLVLSGIPYQINALDITSHRQTPILKAPQITILMYARSLPDNLWVSFTVRTQVNRARHCDRTARRLQSPSLGVAWIYIAEGEPGLRVRADWSPDGAGRPCTSTSPERWT